jgi:uncharacterized protein (DUF1800 family)
MGMSVRASGHGRVFAGLYLMSAALASAQTLSHAPDLMFHDGFSGLGASGTANLSASDASRFLAQATFGPTDADVAFLRTRGYQSWLNVQFDPSQTKPTYEITNQTGQTAYLNWISTAPMNERIGQSNRQEAWFLGALGGVDPKDNTIIHRDQLRQRVAFALSEILVVSQENSNLSDWPTGMAYYYDALVRNAFGNYRVLLEQVTLSPAMGVYLNMMGNRRADLAQNQHPDENYAREINQLFGIGLVMLNQDGTPQLTGGQTSSTYTQNTITNFAHVLTGWNWAHCDANGYDNFVGCFTPYNTPGDWMTPMVAYETMPSKETGNPPDYNYHDNGSHADDIVDKQLLVYPGVANNGVVPNNQTAYQDLTFALDNIYNHPNVAPFISKQLIMRLVTSNPSPAYVQRVAKVFNDNRTIPWQLQMVVQAILLDPEARYGQWRSPDTFGKLREPLLALTHFWRAMHAQHSCGINVAATGTPGTDGYSPPSNYGNQPYRYAGYGTAWSTADTQYGSGIAQASLDAFTVFNFFKPSFLPSGEMASRSLFGPEFQLQTDSVIANSTNSTFGRTFWYDIHSDYDPYNHPGVHCDPGDLFGDVMVDFTQDVALAGSGSGGASDALVDAYNTRFMSGQMSPFMRQTLIDHLNTVDATTWGTDWATQRVKRALMLILTSPEYMVQK